MIWNLGAVWDPWFILHTFFCQYTLLFETQDACFSAFDVFLHLPSAPQFSQPSCRRNDSNLPGVLDLVYFRAVWLVSPLNVGSWGRILGTVEL